MSFLSFLLGIIIVASVDCLVGFLIWLLYKYVDLKYFSTFDIEILKKENAYLKDENKKVGGASTDFWDDRKKLKK